MGYSTHRRAVRGQLGPGQVVEQFKRRPVPDAPGECSWSPGTRNQKEDRRQWPPEGRNTKQIERRWKECPAPGPASDQPARPPGRSDPQHRQRLTSTACSTAAGPNSEHLLNAAWIARPRRSGRGRCGMKENERGGDPADNRKERLKPLTRGKQRVRGFRCWAIQQHRAGSSGKPARAPSDTIALEIVIYLVMGFQPASDVRLPACTTSTLRRRSLAERRARRNLVEGNPGQITCNGLEILEARGWSRSSFEGRRSGRIVAIALARGDTDRCWRWELRQLPHPAFWWCCRARRPGRWNSRDGHRAVSELGWRAVLRDFAFREGRIRDT